MSLKKDSKTTEKRSSSMGIGKTSSASSLGEGSPLTPQDSIPSEAYGEQLYDCCAFLVFCQEHKNIAINRGGKGLWLPFITMKDGDAWKDKAIEGILLILTNGDIKIFENLDRLPFESPELLDVFRIQSPGNPRFFIRVTYAVKLVKCDNWKCCTPGPRIEWIFIEKIISNSTDNLWGPEVAIFGYMVMQPRIAGKKIYEYSMADALLYSPQEPMKRKDEGELLKSAGYTEKGIIKLYKEFLLQTYPSQYMKFSSFVNFMTRIGWNPTDQRFGSFFRSFNYRGNGFLTFHEVILGLGGIEQTTTHGGKSGELRCGYIFRYYDTNNDGYLDLQDIIRMVYDIYKLKGPDIDEAAVDREARARMKSMGLKETDLLPFSVFLHAVGAITFRGTSKLCRSKIAVMHQINKKKIEPLPECMGTNCVTEKRKYKGVCTGCKCKTFRLALHGVKIDSGGNLLEVSPLVESDATDVSFTTEDSLTESLRVYSRETVYNPRSDSNITLELLRAIDVEGRKVQKVRSWNTVEREAQINAIQSICLKAMDIFSQEPRCVQVDSPGFVFGDIHGNLQNLMVYERLFWRTGPALSHPSFLFLGDYVDRGDFGVECVMYLLALKILAPNKYFFCRGNHEIRSVQTVFTFQRECYSKFGNSSGHIIWESMNKVFDRMPVCALIDNCIYCAHGGIPATVHKLEDILKIPTPLIEPETDSPPAWEIMWNDPISFLEFNDLANYLKLQPQCLHGFLSNTKRGTAFYYTEEAINHFLDANGFTHIIRAHEVMPIGYKFHFGGKLMTIFSCSYYCGGNNEAACVYIGEEKIRVIRIQTVSNR